MGHFHSLFIPPNILPCSAPLSRPLKRPSLPNTSQLAKRCKTSHQHPSTSHATQTDDRDEREESSYDDSCHQVFLSHSGKQKDFVEQLFKDLQRENISCFFDKDPESLPKGEDFPSRIFEAAEKCKVGVVVLSEDFISSKWPMQELSAFVKAQNSTNPKIKILPLFFRLSTDSLLQKLQNKDSLKKLWQKFLKAQKRKVDWDEWLNALEALRRINGVNYVEQDGEVAYRAQIVGHIRSLVRPNLKYEESHVQGKERLCQEVADLFNNTPCHENGVKIAGLHGIGGSGKTTLARIVCNFYSNDFDGRVFHVEVGKKNPIETLRGALTNLTDASETLVNSVRTIQQGGPLFKKRMYGKKVFLAIDNISDLAGSIEEVKMYLSAVCSAGTPSIILLTARSSIVLQRFIPERKRQCMHVPSLKEEEAIAVLLQLTPVKVCELSNEAKDNARRYVRKCGLLWHRVSCGVHNMQFFAHPLLLKVFGAYLYDYFGSRSDPSQWIDIHNSIDPWRPGDIEEKVFSIFNASFQRLRDVHKMVFMFLCLYLPESHMALEEALDWLALACSRDIEDIKSAVIELKRKGFVESIEEFRLPLYIHDLFIEFAANKAEGSKKWILLKDKDEIPKSLQEALSSDRPRFLAMRIDNCHFQYTGFFNDDVFKNILVLHLQHMPQWTILNLSPMKIVRSITIFGCGGMEEIRGLENLSSLVYFRVEGCSTNIQLSGIEHLAVLQVLKVHANLRKTVTQWLPWHQWSFPPLQYLSNVGSLQLDNIEEDTRRLHLSGCPRLRTIKLSQCGITEIDFSGCLEIRRIELDYCENLSEIRLPSPHLLTNLEYVNITARRGMHSLKKLPSLTGLINLLYLRLGGMHSLEEVPSFTGLIKLYDLRLEGMHSLTKLPSFTGLTSLRLLNLEGMHSLRELPSLTGLTSLRYLSLEGMHSLRELPSLTGLTSLLSLNLKGMHSLRELPSFTGLTSLCDLGLKDMHRLRELPSLTGLTSLDNLTLKDMHMLRELPSLTGLTSLLSLTLDGMNGLRELPSLTELTGLYFLTLGSMHGLRELPSLTGLTGLHYLKLEGMHRLREFPSLTGLTSLFSLRLEGMHKLRELPSLAGLTGLRDFRLGGETQCCLKEILTGLTGLRYLWLDGTHRLEDLPPLPNLAQLRLGDGMNCLKEILTGLTGLRVLRLDGTHRLEDLPHLPNLEHLVLGDGMNCLKETPGALRNINIWYADLSDQRLKEVESLPGVCSPAFRVQYGNCVLVWKRCLAEGCGRFRACDHFAGGKINFLQLCASIQFPYEK